MEKEKYIAYVGTYTHGSSIGIHLYDVDVEEGTLSERKVVPVNNSSYVVKSKNGKYLNARETCFFKQFPEFFSGRGK